MGKIHYLTYTELMQLALENYNKGGDATYECWDERTFNSYVSMFGGITKKEALKMFKDDYSISKERCSMLHSDWY